MKSSPLDAEQFASLDERDRAMLQGYGAGGQGGGISDDEGDATVASSIRAGGQGRLELVMRRLNELGISPQEFDNWELNVLEHGEAARLQLVFACLVLHN